MALFERAAELITLGAARTAGDGRIVAKGDVELGVGDFLNAGGGLAGVPWITLPLAEIDGAPLGVSLISACGTDAWLLELSKPLVQNR